MPRRSSLAAPLFCLLLGQSACLLNTSGRPLNAGDIRGTAVTGAAGSGATPAAGATVALEDSVITTTTAADGTFVLPSMPDGTYVLDITTATAGLRTKPVTLNTNTGTNGQDLGQLVLSDFGIVSGTVTNIPAFGTTDGGVIPPPTVVLSGVISAGSSGTELTTIGQVNVTSAGTFSFTNVPPNDPASPYQVAAFAESSGAMALVGNAVTVNVKASATQSATIDLSSASSVSSTSASGSISGVAQFVNTSGSGDNSDISIQLDSPDVDSASLVLINCSATSTDSQGDYSVSSVTPGVYTLTASSGGSGSVVINGIFVGGGTTTLPTITLTTGNGLPDAGPSTDVTRIQAGCEQEDLWNGNPFPTVATCQEVVGSVVTALEANTSCTSVATDVLLLADCYAGVGPGAATCTDYTTGAIPCLGAFMTLSNAAPACSSPCGVIAGPIVNTPTTNSDGGTGSSCNTDGGMTDAG